MEQTTDTRGIVDTDILIDGQRRRDDARDFLARQRRVVGLEISVISAMELVKGCQNALALARAEQFLRVVRVLPISGTASRVAYHLIQRFYLSHGLLIPDALIAATALDYGVTLYTKNVRHFLMIPGLTILRPY